eukprot:2171103-Rhodomonas_salina.3
MAVSIMMARLKLESLGAVADALASVKGPQRAFKVSASSGCPGGMHRSSVAGSTSGYRPESHPSRSEELYGCRVTLGVITDIDSEYIDYDPLPCRHAFRANRGFVSFRVALSRGRRSGNVSGCRSTLTFRPSRMSELDQPLSPKTVIPL